MILTKKLDVAQSYRRSLIEAVRITTAAGAVFPPDIVAMLASVHEKHEPSVPAMLSLLCSFSDLVHARAEEQPDGILRGLPRYFC